MPNPPGQAPSHLRSPHGAASIHLDALRGVAAVGVCFSHLRDFFFLDYPRLPHHNALLAATYLATGLENAATNLATNGEILTDLIALTIGVLVAFEISRQLFRWEPEAKLPGRAKLWVVAAMIPFIAFGTYENVKGDRLTRIRQDFQMMNRTATTAPPARPH